MPKQLSVGLYFKPKVVRTLARCPQMTTGGTSERAHNWQLCNIIIQRVALRVAPISPKVLLTLSPSHSVIIVGRVRAGFRYLGAQRSSNLLSLSLLFPIDYGRRRHLKWASRGASVAFVVHLGEETSRS